jgi:lipopolysaccharide transport system ATP-binding protein
MSSNFAISVNALSKCYHIYSTPRDRLLQMLSPSSKTRYQEFWAVRDVTFQIAKGETVGIVGRNGSGKSTLLQMICGTLNPSSGSIETHGRIAALLELGSGFNPEFTGRENVYLNASILGLSKEETDARFDDIAAFADIGAFIEQPVKSYSSGMMVRLAFSVAINVDPEILIVDEALSVGDEVFQRKCFSRIEAIKRNGATILFVSHSGSTIVELCDRVVLMDSGENLAVGLPKTIVAKYQRLIYAPDDKRAELRAELKNAAAQQIGVHEDNSDSLAASATKAKESRPLEFFDENLISNSVIHYESQGALIENPQIHTLSGSQVNNLIGRTKYRYSYQVHFTRAATQVRFGMVIKTVSGFSLGGAVSAPSSKMIPYVAANSTISVTFDLQCNLNPGAYFLNAGAFGMGDGEETVLHRLVDALVFRVSPPDENISTEVIDFHCEPGIEIHE